MLRKDDFGIESSHTRPMISRRISVGRSLMDAADPCSAISRSRDERRGGVIGLMGAADVLVEVQAIWMRWRCERGTPLFGGIGQRGEGEGAKGSVRS